LHSISLSWRSSATTRPYVGSISLSIATAFYTLFFQNMTFWSKAADYMSGQAVPHAALAVGLAALYSATLVAVSIKYLTKPLFITLIVIGAASSWFMDRFGVIIDPEMIRNAAETTRVEARHLISTAFILHMVVFGLVPALFICWIKVEHQVFRKKLVRNAAVVVGCLVITVAAALSEGSLFASLTRQHRDWFATLNPVVPLSSALRYAIGRGSERDIVAKPLGTDAVIAGGQKGRKPRLMIFVVGETARAQNFSLGGYERETNPELAAEDIFYFRDTTSCGTATAVSLPCMFSVYDRSDYSHAKSIATENLVDVLAHAGINVEWWDNNTGSKGIARRVKEIRLTEPGDPRFCADGECQDGYFVDLLDSFLGNVKQDTVLILHQIGSHGPSYFQRYPESFRRFTPDCRTADLAKCSSAEIVNAYDNTVLYTDHVLAAIIEKLKSRQDTLSTVLVYASDHGESLGEYGLYLHGAPYLIAPAEQTHVPFLLWLGSDAKRDADLECIAAETGKPQSHDNLFHTVLGLMHVETSVHAEPLDILHACKRSAGT
jgi:lipid A ethanolaminephosphotransferase